MAMTNPMPRPAKLECIVSAWPRNLIELPLGQLLFRLGDERLEVAQDAAQVAPADAAEDINDRHDVVVGIDGRHRRCGSPWPRSPAVARLPGPAGWR